MTSALQMIQGGPLDEALVLVMQKMERRIVACLEHDDARAALEQENLRLACIEYNQLRSEADAASQRAHRRRVPSLKRPAEQGELPLHGWLMRWSSLTPAERRNQRERWQEQLLPAVLSMADVAAGEGITASDVISRGITDGILIGERPFLAAHPRVYSFVGRWLARLAVEGLLAPLTIRAERGGVLQVRRESDRKASKGNLGKVYVAAGLST